VHLVGFITRIYHDARLPGRQIRNLCLKSKLPSRICNSKKTTRDTYCTSLSDSVQIAKRRDLRKSIRRNWF